MHDTNPEIFKKMDEMFQQKSPLERLRMGCSMHDTSKHLITCSILRENPTISQQGLRREIFLRFYGNDYDPQEREKIIKYLESHTRESASST